MHIDRRSLLKVGTLGIGALAFPGAAQPLIAARGFTHNVASGEPVATRVMLWTRYVPARGSSANLRYHVALDPLFRRIVGEGRVEASAARDFTVKPVVQGLPQNSWLYFRFEDRAGARSPVGRTRTLPAGSIDRFRLGVFSCSNLPFGHFNAYGHAAARDDIDLVVHLGDYLYEYQRGTYPSAQAALAGRIINPATEMIALADYRLRYASYRADPDLQELHRRFPMVMMWDDHESANDSWQGGAENHDAGEGDWATRKAAAMRACREWLPVSEANWTSYEIGDLATIFRPETRLVGRTQQLDLDTVLEGAQPAEYAARLTAFRDGPWQDQARTLMGREQETWLYEGLRASTRSGRKWQVLAQQLIVGNVKQPPQVAAVAPSLPAGLRRYVEVGAAAASVGLPMSMDMWDGYPAARSRLLQAAQGANANLIVLSGDSHNAWAFDLAHDNRPAGVEFAGHSVTSPGFESSFSAVPPPVVANLLVAANPELKWAETARRGYMTVELTPHRATSEFLFLNTIRERSTAIAERKTLSVAHGTNRLAAI